MRPGIREQCLESVSEAMAVLNLERVIAGVRVVPHQIKLARELRIRRYVNILPHQLPACRAEVGHCEDIGLSKSRLHRSVPLIRSRQDVIRVYHRKKLNRGSRRKRRWRGIGRAERE